MDRFRAQVNNGVYYDDEGRVFHKSGRDNSFPGFTAVKDTRGDQFFSYDPYRQNNRTTGVLNKAFRRDATPRAYQSTPNTPIITRRLDEHRSVPALTYKTESRPSDYYYSSGPTVVRTAYSDPFPRTREVGAEVINDYDRRDLITADNSYRSTTVVEERIIPTERPVLWWLFIVDGILLLVAGVLQILFCIDYHYYSRIWAGILLIMFGISGSFHGGNYRSMLKNWLYIILGFVSTAAVFFCAAYDLRLVGHNTMQLSEEKIAPWTRRSADYWRDESSPLMRLNGDDLIPNVWLCYGVDWVVLILLMIAMLVLTSTMRVFNHYCDANYEFVRVVRPSCEPALFNPYGQVSMGQAIMFWGMIQVGATHGNFVIRWQNIFAPVWAGIIPIIAGFVAAVALKRTDGKHKLLGFIALILEFLSFAGLVVAVVITAIGMYDNVNALGESPVMSKTEFSKQLLTASIILFCFGLVIFLAGIIFAIALFVRLLITMCCDNSSYESEDYREKIYPSREKLSSQDISSYNARL